MLQKYAFAAKIYSPLGSGIESMLQKYAFPAKIYTCPESGDVEVMM
jgi:hypothetical protein